MKSILVKMRDFLARKDGVSAIEFALVAPMLGAGLVGVADVGMAINERMMIDNALRSGAQAAMRDPGETKTERIMRLVYFGKATEAKNVAKFAVDRFCLCPEQLYETEQEGQSCEIQCEGNKLPHIFYGLKATKIHPGIFMTNFDLSSSLEVQVR